VLHSQPISSTRLYTHRKCKEEINEKKKEDDREGRRDENNEREGEKAEFRRALRLKKRKL
jgi:hypothetical protein